jgi:cob(I)alamin adenosyltransferase
MAIYTKRGDAGETSLYDKKNTQRSRISKDSFIIETLGTIDELNSVLGVSLSFCKRKKTRALIKEVQSNLLVIGSITAGSKLRFSKTKTQKFEKIIDELESKLPVLKNFLLPGGTKFASHLHLARSVSRRLERRMVKLSKTNEVKPQVLVYLNRLSDFLFMLARDDNFSFGEKESFWKSSK